MMQEWGKVVFSTLAGMVAGFIANPLNTTIQRWMTIRLVRKVMHLELARLEDEFSMGSAITEPQELKRAGERMVNFRTDAFDYYFETQRALFFSDEKLYRMRVVLDDLKGFLTDPRAGRRSFHDARAFGLGLIKDAMTLQIFNAVVVSKYRKQNKDMSLMMVFAGLGDLTESDILPKRSGLRHWFKVRRQNKHTA